MADTTVPSTTTNTPEYGRIEHDGWVTRWGPGWQATYPVGAMIQVEFVDEDTDG